MSEERKRRIGAAPARPCVYLAGPDVFLKDAPKLAARKKRLCTKHGFEGVFPLDAKISQRRSAARTAIAIAAANEALIRRCDILIANCSPFRGVSMDVGTAYEIGYARALGKPVYGYTNVLASYKDRALSHRRGEAFATDCLGSSIEDFGLAENLMVATAVFGHDLVRQSVKQGRELVDLAGFARCLVLARAALAREPRWPRARFRLPHLRSGPRSQ